MADWKSVELFDDISPGNVQYAFDDYQFVWVDGRFNNVARRVVIDNDGAITPSTIGVPKPQARAAISSVVFNSLKDKGTGIPRGKLLLICYTYTDNEEHESNPSPITAFDTGQYMAKGHYVKDGVIYENQVEGGEYIFENTQNGSIENVVIAVPIISANLKRVNLYVAYADYPESVIPPSSFLLSESRLIVGKEAGDTISVVISSIPGIPEVSYENDVAPKGDDITLADSVVFVGNAVNTLGLPGSVSRVWALDITNNNKTNYVNRFHRLDLFDETVHPDDGSYIEGLDWDTAIMANYRIFDEDLSTPLDVFHYPHDSQIKLPKAEGVSDPDATAATLQIGTPGTDSGMLLTARNSGASGNGVSFESIIGQSSGVVLADSHDEANYGFIMVETAGGGVHNGSIQLVKPASYDTEIVITDNITDDRHDITIQLATNNDMGFTIASSQGEVLAAIMDEMGTGGELEGIITAAYGTGEYDEDYVYPDDNANAVPFNPLSEYASVSSNKVSLYLGFNSTTETIQTTISQAVSILNSNAAVIALLTATADVFPGLGAMVEVSETSLSGGSGDTIVAATDICNTRLLAWIRVPIIRAHSDKTLYLVEFNEIDGDLEGEFTELESSDISDFYADHVSINPILDENVPVAVRYDVDETISDYASYEESLKYNAANLFLVPSDYSAVAKGSVNAPIYDELCAAESVSPTIERKAWTHTLGGGSILYETSQNWTLQGYAWVCRKYLAPVNYADHEIMALGEGLKLVHNYRGIQIELVVGGEPVIKLIPASTFNSLGAFDGSHVSFLLAWDQIVYGGVGATPLSTLAIRLCVAVNGKAVWTELIFDGYGLDTSELFSISFAKSTYSIPLSGQSYPVDFGCRLGENIQNIYQAVNALRYMPVYLTEGIGAFSEFTADNDSPANLIFNNTGLSTRTINTNGDTKPGKLQWGNYGAMPDLNEFVLNEDIMAIAPLKSYMPTDEHNTILIFTRNNVHRLALFGESAQECKSIKELNGYGLLYRNAICELPTGIAWLSQKGIMLITVNGITNLTQSRLNTEYIEVLTYDRERNWIWARGSYDDDGDTIQVTYVYQIDEGLWWSYAGLVHPDDFMGCIDEETGWISYIDKIMYMESDDPHDFDEEEDDPEVEDYLTYIKTRAIALVKKLGRIRLISTLSAGTFRFFARMWGHRITDYSTESAEFGGQNNVLTSIPGVGADFVQLDIIEANNIVALSTEYENGVRNG